MGSVPGPKNRRALVSTPIKIHRGNDWKKSVQRRAKIGQKKARSNYNIFMW